MLWRALAVRAVSFARVPEAVLREAVDETAGLIRPRHDDAIDFFGTRYSTIRQFAPAFLRTLTFHTHGPDDTVLRAVEVIHALDREPTRRPVLRDVPMALVTDAWRPYIREPDGSISRRYMNCAPCGTSAAPSAPGISGLSIAGAMPIWTPLSFPLASGLVGGQRSCAKPGRLARGWSASTGIVIYRTRPRYPGALA
jgi:hypothetical protein